MATGGFYFELDVSPLIAWFQHLGPERMRVGTEKGLYRHALEVMAKSQEIVPIGGPPTSPYDPAPGTLKASGTVLLPTWDSGRQRVEVVLGYGGAAEAYAWRQHEDLTYRHKDGQSAKYLEGPMNEQESELLGRIADGIQEG